MTPFSLVPKDVNQFPSLMQMLSKVRHPVARYFDQLSRSKIHHLYRNVNELVCKQCRVRVEWHVEEHITAKYYNQKQCETQLLKNYLSVSFS